MADEHTPPAVKHEYQSRWQQVLTRVSAMIRENPKYQGLMLISLAGSLALAIVLVIWSNSTDYQPLYGSQEIYDVGGVTDALEQAGIAYRVHPGSGQVLVDASRLPEARMQLAAAGIKPEKPEGLEVLDKEQPLGTSQFLENVRYRRGLEGELARTIISLRQVRNARVHLALPRKSAFVRKAEKPSASVFVDLLPGQTLDKTQVEAIVNLIAGSVPGMVRESITIVDQHGTLLSRELSMRNNGLDLAERQLDYIDKLEQTYENRVSTLLEPIVGYGNFRVEVSADVDLNRIEQTSEEYDPQAQAVRSEHSSERRETGGKTGVPGTLSNEPPLTGEEQPAGKEVGQKEFTRNYEVDRVVKHVTRQQGTINRLSIAVVLNESAMAGGSVQMEDLKQLVRDAIGFTEARNDQISIHTANFVVNDAIAESGIAWWESPQILYYFRYLIGGILSLAVIMFLLRPLVQRIVSPPEPLPAPVDDAAEAAAAFKAAHPDLGLFSDESLSLLPPEVADFETQLVSARKLAHKEPERVAQVVKMWMNTTESS
ncbi:flagellar basal-body MS-ring/collar protein FliF [Kistimonas asteriae]|uniref:flagellar basal-body MS-ring/collar protein FliF n=1 Tax=Kistimonas asteriae TaxID=517724 RepID=UPI001BA8A507|nr:flagellar basal-body MS-ring/collar protein FliF [Kistimonas asteriae]